MLGFGRRATVVTLQFSHGTCKWKTISSSKKRCSPANATLVCHFGTCGASTAPTPTEIHFIALKSQLAQWKNNGGTSGLKNITKGFITAWPGRVVCVLVSFQLWMSCTRNTPSTWVPGTCCLSSILGRNNPPKHCLFQGSFKVSRLMEKGHQWNCCCFLFWSSRCVCVWFPVFFLPRLVPDSRN